MSDREPAELDIETRSQGGGGPVSYVWLVPLAALAIALFIAWQAYSSRGPLIEIRLDSAEGITASSTALKYRDVNVGIVEDLTFTEDLQAVVAAVRVQKDVAPYIDSDAEFWLVRPQVTARGVSGLGTVLSGVYLEGTWDSTIGQPHSEFTALANPPLMRVGEQGVEIVLRAPMGGRLQAGAPVVFRGIDVGSLDQPQLAPDGQSVTAHAFIKAPHDQLITDQTRFWASSGFSVNIGSGGVSLNVASLAALLEGGVSFETFGGDATPAASGAVYEVFDTEQAARDNVASIDTAGDIPFAVDFEGSVSGLVAGAPVEFEGLRVGSVSGLTIVTDVSGESPGVLMRTNIALAPDRLGLPDDAEAQATIDFVSTAVSNGLRARLASQGLLSTSLKIELVSVADAPAATLETEGVEPPQIPTTAPAISDVAESARGVLTRIDNLPIEALLASATSFMDGLNTIVTSQDTQQAPAAVLALIDDMRGIAGSGEIEATVAEARNSIAQISALLERVNESPALPAVLSALERSDAIAQSLQDSAAELPGLLSEIQSVAETARALPLQDLLDRASQLVANVEGALSPEELASLSQTLNAALDNVRQATEDARALTGSIRQGPAVDNLIAALQRTESIAASIDSTAAGLPDLVSRIDALVATAADLPLDALARSATDILQSADAVISAPQTAQLPATLNTALTELSGALADIRIVTGQINNSTAVASLIAALDRADAISRSVEDTAAGLPPLLDDIRAVAAEAEALPLADVVASADALLTSANTLIGSDDTAQIPAALTLALNELGLALTELRESGAIAAASDTLASASTAADAIAEAAEGLPALTARLDSLIATSEGVLGSYGAQSQFNAQTLAAIRDLRDAARAVSSLARTIERKPNSLLIGR